MLFDRQKPPNLKRVILTFGSRQRGETRLRQALAIAAEVVEVGLGVADRLDGYLRICEKDLAADPREIECTRPKMRMRVIGRRHIRHIGKMEHRRMEPPR